MTLKEKIKWQGQLADRRNNVRADQEKIDSGKAHNTTYYFFVGTAAWYAVELYLEGEKRSAKNAAEVVVKAAQEYFYGDWRKRIATPDGKIGQEAWNPFCLWYEQVGESLPFATALSDWESVKRIAAYPPDQMPSQAESRGESAWGWALISYLRGDSRQKIEALLLKAENLKTAKRPKMLCPVLKALMDNNPVEFEKTLLAYLTYYRKSEFKLLVSKVLALDGTILYHLGRKQGFNVTLPENVADHVIRFE